MSAVLRRKALAVVLAALAMAFTSAKFLAQGTALVTMPWGIIALLIGWLAKNKREALVLGGCWGFAASYSYLWFDTTSKLALNQVVVLIFLIVLPALFGLLCGLLVSWLGWAVRQRL